MSVWRSAFGDAAVKPRFATSAPKGHKRLAQGFSPGFGSKQNRPERAADVLSVVADVFGSRPEWAANRDEACVAHFGRPREEHGGATHSALRDGK